MFDESKYNKRVDGIMNVCKFIVGKGVDIGCGTEPVHPDIIALDQQPDRRYAHADIVHNCENLDVFAENVLDFIFSSHCLEDFENIPEVFRSWWSRLKIGGVMVLLLPDMQGGRYPTVAQGGNPSHRTDVGVPFMTELLENGDYNYEILQKDTILHNESCTFDFVIKRKG